MKNRFKEISRGEAVAKVTELKKSFMELRFKLVLGHVENPLEKRNIRRQIARLNTIIAEYDQGIRKA
ncbi:MAG: 50S ribosomal protein L29 [Spirochaetales bacterium]